ncbi:MAG: hypothetical protein JOS17DRAFT_764856 [Linnemannia elongata]|nr:MAG: hypothetical protein JOS17DRAFT_764856 [Linnemannia elongata]
MAARKSWTLTGNHSLYTRPVANSPPPSFQTPHKRVWPLMIMAPEGERLTIGTTSFDPLATSSLCLDISMKPSIGCTPPSFLLSSMTHSLATRVFLDAESLESGLKIAARRDSWSVSSGNLM